MNTPSPRRSNPFLRFIILAVCVVPSLQSGAQTVTTWTGGIGNWSDPLKWNNGLPNGAAFEARVDDGNAASSTVTVDGNYTVGRLTLTDTVTIGNGSTLTVDRSAGFTGAGEIGGNGGFLRMESLGLTTRIFAAGDLTISRSIFGNGNANNVITGSAGSTVTLGSLTNLGIGDVGDGAVNLILTGSLFGGSTGGGETVVRPASTFVQQAGAGLSVSRGTLRLAGTGTFTLNGFVSVNNNGTEGFSALFVRDASAAFANFDPATRTLGGSTYGVIGTSGPATVSLNVGDIFINNTEISMTGAASTFDGLGALKENRGKLSFNVRSFTSAGAFVNSGTLTAAFQRFTSTGLLTNSGTVSLNSSTSTSNGTLTCNAGYTQTAGRLRLGGTTVLASFVTSPNAPVLIEGGRLEGAGTINANLENDGVVAPFTVFNQSGRLTVNGTLALGGTSTLEFRAGNTAQFGLKNDSVVVNGAAAIDGILALVRRLDGDPTASSVFTLLSATSLTGTFDNVFNGQRIATTDGVGSFVVHYGPGSTFNQNQVVIDGYELVPEPSSVMAMLGVAGLFLSRRGRGPGRGGITPGRRASLSEVD